jgi:hypothetical protein
MTWQVYFIEPATKNQPRRLEVVREFETRGQAEAYLNELSNDVAYRSISKGIRESPEVETLPKYERGGGDTYILAPPTEKSEGTTRSPEEQARIERKHRELISAQQEKLYGKEKAKQYLGERYIPPEERSTTKPKGEVMTKEEFEKLKEAEKQKRFAETTKKIKEKKQIEKLKAEQRSPTFVTRLESDVDTGKRAEKKSTFNQRGYEEGYKNITAGGTIVASSQKREAKLSKYGREQYNKYLRGQQTYQEYVRNVERANKGVQVSASPRPKTLGEKLLAAGDKSFYRAEKERYKKGATSKAKEVYYTIKGTAATTAGGVIRGTKGVWTYAKEHPYQTAGTLALVLLPEAISTAVGSAKLYTIARAAVGGYFAYAGGKYALDAVSRIQTAPPREKLATTAAVGGEVATAAAAFKVVSKVPQVAGSVVRYGSDLIYSAKLSAKYKRALVTKPSGELAEIIREPSTELKVKAITGYEGKYIKGSTARGTEITEGEVKPIYSKSFYTTGRELAEAPKDFIVAYEINRAGVQFPPQDLYAMGQYQALSKARATSFKSKKRGITLVNIKDIQRYSKPYHYTSEFPTGYTVRYLEAGSLRAGVHAVDLSASKEIMSAKKQKSYKKKRSQYYDLTNKIIYRPPKLDYQQEVLVAGSSKGAVAIFQSFFNKRLSKLYEKYDAPLIVEKIKVRSKDPLEAKKEFLFKSLDRARDRVDKHLSGEKYDLDIDLMLKQRAYIKKIIKEDKDEIDIITLEKKEGEIIDVFKTKKRKKYYFKKTNEGRQLFIESERGAGDQKTIVVNIVKLAENKYKLSSKQKLKSVQKSKVEQKFEQQPKTVQDIGAVISQTKFSKLESASKARSKAKQKPITVLAVGSSATAAQAAAQLSKPISIQAPRSAIGQGTRQTPRQDIRQTPRTTPALTPILDVPTRTPPTHYPPRKPPAKTPPALFLRRGKIKFGRSTTHQRKVRQPKSYTPTGYAAIGGIRGKPTEAGIKTGLGIRPVKKLKKKLKLKF